MIMKEQEARLKFSYPNHVFRLGRIMDLQKCPASFFTTVNKKLISRRIYVDIENPLIFYNLSFFLCVLCKKG